MALMLTWPVSAEITLPDGPGVNLVYAQCRTCHDLQYVRDAKGLMPAQWKSVIDSMRDYGYKPAPGTEAGLLEYLTTYLGTSPPPTGPAGVSAQRAAADAAPAAGHASATPSAVDGGALFAQNCAGCHGAEGRGQPGYFPPLAANPDVARDPLLPVLVMLHGLSGSIEVGGKTYDGIMPPFDHLSDSEVAAVANFVQSGWGGKASDRNNVDASMVAAQRLRTMTPAQVYAYRERPR